MSPISGRAWTGGSPTGRRQLALGHRARGRGAQPSHARAVRCVVVGAETVRHDDPQLTVLVEGESDARRSGSRGRLKASHRMFTDGAAPTLVLCADELAGRKPASARRRWSASLPRLDACVPSRCSTPSPGAGWRVFVEGGGITVSRFLAAGCLPPADHDRAADHRLGPPEHFAAEDRASERACARRCASSIWGGTFCSNAGSMAEARAFWTVAPGQGELRSESLPSRGRTRSWSARASGISRGTETRCFWGACRAGQHRVMRAPPGRRVHLPREVRLQLGRIVAGTRRLARPPCSACIPTRIATSCRAAPASRCRRRVRRARGARREHGNRRERAVGRGAAHRRPGHVVGAGVIGALAAAAARIPGAEVQLVDVNLTRPRSPARSASRSPCRRWRRRGPTS